jgi:hypothetical protein
MTTGRYRIKNNKYEIDGNKFEAIMRILNDLNNRITDLEEWHRQEEMSSCGQDDQFLEQLKNVFKNALKELEEEDRLKGPQSIFGMDYPCKYCQKPILERQSFIIAHGDCHENWQIEIAEAKKQK